MSNIALISWAVIVEMCSCLGASLNFGLTNDLPFGGSYNRPIIFLLVLVNFS